ncbi:MAG: type II secretion system protein [Wenzhouxiangellaceae bacterium]|nr:type II secretion system protein [Wenzhouxiangellaceae bacterium]
MRTSGFTLIETIVALVLIGVAGAVLLRTFIGPLAASADPQIRAQARSIASAYMDEILLRRFGTGSDCVGTGRANWETIGCYANLDQAPTDQLGNPIAGLGAYRVQTSVNAAGDVATIIVTVQHPPSGLTLNLESRRGNY